MKNAILGLALLCSANVFAAHVDATCAKLVDGNFTKDAYTTVKAVDFDLALDTEANHAEFKGSYLTKAGKYHAENESVRFYTAIYKTSFVQVGDAISASLHESSFWTCGSGGTPCHSWKSFAYNLKTKEGTLRESHSYSTFGSVRTVELAIKFICQ